jgi:microcystin-dependent protein
MQGNLPIHWGQGPGLSLYDLGETGGSDTVTLLQSEMPSHPHTLMSDGGDSPDTASPTNAALVLTPNIFSSLTNAIVPMAPLALALAGSSLPHNNLMPYLTLNFCIALQGVYPPRT